LDFNLSLDWEDWAGLGLVVRFERWLVVSKSSLVLALDLLTGASSSESEAGAAALAGGLRLFEAAEAGAPAAEAAGEEEEAAGGGGAGWIVIFPLTIKVVGTVEEEESVDGTGDGVVEATPELTNTTRAQETAVFRVTEAKRGGEREGADLR
jgi:hypothetical protein